MKKTYSTPVMEMMRTEDVCLFSGSAVSPTSTKTLQKSNDELYGIENEEDIL